MVAGDPAGRTKPRFTRRTVLIALLLVVGLAVVSDFTAAAFTEYRMSRALRVDTQLDADPGVTVEDGWRSFLVQALGDRFKKVRIGARMMRPDIPGQIALEADLYGVHLSWRDLNSGNIRAVPVDRVVSTMTIQPTELSRIFGIADLSVNTPAGDKSDGSGGSGGSGTTTSGPLVLTGSIPLEGETKPTTTVSVYADLLLDGDQVRIVATGQADAADKHQKAVTVPPAEEPNVFARFTRTIDTRNMPFGVRPETVRARGGDITVTGNADHTTVDLNRFARS
ncbi:DUF2993 domain-containing protein [Nocardia stercoris]|uniref:DUF2993 domain-containing protein n=2 Tax=Nocardia stercoris TaxID=2483361 RepID=A0A3M2L1P7_9NOCA|nr:DUF2993 domain-containing protein [Nocardia stercoris]